MWWNLTKDNEVKKALYVYTSFSFSFLILIQKQCEIVATAIFVLWLNEPKVNISIFSLLLQTFISAASNIFVDPLALLSLVKT